jgi:hypothetical protein
LGRLVYVGSLLPLDGLEEGERLGRGASRVGRRELDLPQQRGQEATHLAVAGPQALEVVVVGRADQVGNQGDSLGEPVPGDVGEDGFRHANDREGVAAEDGAVGGGVAGNVRVDSLGDFGKRVGVEEGLVQRSNSRH